MFVRAGFARAVLFTILFSASAYGQSSNGNLQSIDVNFESKCTNPGISIHQSSASRNDNGPKISKPVHQPQEINQSVNQTTNEFTISVNIVDIITQNSLVSAINTDHKIRIFRADYSSTAGCMNEDGKKISVKKVFANIDGIKHELKCDGGKENKLLLEGHKDSIVCNLPAEVKLNSPARPTETDPEQGAKTRDVGVQPIASSEFSILIREIDLLKNKIGALSPPSEDPPPKGPLETFQDWLYLNYLSLSTILLVAIILVIVLVLLKQKNYSANPSGTSGDPRQNLQTVPGGSNDQTGIHDNHTKMETVLAEIKALIAQIEGSHRQLLAAFQAKMAHPGQQDFGVEGVAGVALTSAQPEVTSESKPHVSSLDDNPSQPQHQPFRGSIQKAMQVKSAAKAFAETYAVIAYKAGPPGSSTVIEMDADPVDFEVLFWGWPYDKSNTHLQVLIPSFWVFQNPSMLSPEKANQWFSELFKIERGGNEFYVSAVAWMKQSSDGTLKLAKKGVIHIPT